MILQQKSRRSFLRAVGSVLSTTVLPTSVGLDAQEPPVVLAPYVADVNGNGSVGDGDLQLVDAALFSQRGFDLEPGAGFDQRADVFGRGVVDAVVVDSVRRSIAQYAAAGASRRPRPITVAWHYGWYSHTNRPPGLQMARFKGGNYASFDPEIETTFNDLKNEAGITVDALSWIPRRDPINFDTWDNYRLGLLQASNVVTRHVCLLYESTIALPDAYGGRIDIASTSVRSALRADFADMARDLLEVRDETPARLFTLDDRPVVFIFGSHVWGLLDSRGSTDPREMSSVVEDLRRVFQEVYGAFPYLVGDELSLSPVGDFTQDRKTRMEHFDAIYMYHHAIFKPGSDVTLQPTAGYFQNQIDILRRSYASLDGLRNHFTGHPILVIPNLAPGFAKPGHSTLLFGRAQYAEFMKIIKHVHTSEYVEGQWRELVESPQLPAPIYVVGSWNEEFEGHCVFPFDFNLSVPENTQFGFDLFMAIKEAFGWNHYAMRDIG